MALVRRLLWEQEVGGSNPLAPTTLIFVLLHIEEFADYKSARKREKFLKSGQGREWLNEFESQSEPAKGGDSP